MILGEKTHPLIEEDTPMTLSDIATAQLWETFRAGGGAELVRDAVRLVLQELIEAEATEVVGAARYGRSDARVTERNGHRPRPLATQASNHLRCSLKEPGSRRAKSDATHGPACGVEPLASLAWRSFRLMTC